MSVQLVLGSASPRRAELLTRLGLSFRQSAADIDETPRSGEEPVTYVQRMALEKSRALALTHADSMLLTADTTVILDGCSLGKPEDGDDARRMLTALSGRKHEVATAVCLTGAGRSAACVVRTEVEFASLAPELINDYLTTDEPWDKAGAYAIQGLAGAFVRGIRGSVSNVIGLPLVETRELLEQLDISCQLARGVS